MRYTTARFGEVANLFGEFAQGRPFTSASGINIELYQSPDFSEAVVLTFSGCREVSGSRAGGFATYFWPTSGITTAVSGSMDTEYLYMMRDTQTTRTHKGKFVLGGHPDESAHQQYENQVTIDAASGTAGTDFPVGTAEFPSNNLADALVIREKFNLPRAFDVLGLLTLSGDLTAFSFRGRDPLRDRVTAASGCVLNSCAFERIGVAGDFTASPSGVVASEIVLGVTDQTMSGVRGLFLTALVRGTIRPHVQLIGLGFSTDETFTATLDMTGAPTTRVAIGDVIGAFNIVGATGAGHQIGVGANGARLTLDSTVTGGIFIFTGVGELTDNSTATVSLTDQMVRGTRLDVVVSTRATPAEAADAVWDEAITGHAGVGSTGRNLFDTRRHITNRRRVVSGLDPWLERVYEDDETTTLQDAELRDLAGGNITDTNSPASGILIAERDPV